MLGRHQLSMSPFRLLLVLGALAVGCAARRPTPDPTPMDGLAPAASGLARPSSAIGRGELNTMAGHTAVDAIRMLRPQFLSGVQPPALNGAKVYPSVFVENRPFAGLETLSVVSADALEEVRFLKSSEARNVYGPGCSCDGGVIVLRMRRDAMSVDSPRPIRVASDADRAEGAGSDVITTTELRRLDPALSVMEAVEHARPWFLHPRGSVSMVSIDNSPPTSAAILQRIYVGDVKEIRLLRAAGRSAPVAMRPDGTVAVGDVILVVMANGRP